MEPAHFLSLAGDLLPHVFRGAGPDGGAVQQPVEAGGTQLAQVTVVAWVVNENRSPNSIAAVASEAEFSGVHDVVGVQSLFQGSHHILAHPHLPGQ